MNWLLTCCDSGSYKTARLLTPKGAALYLEKVAGYPLPQALKAVSSNRVEAIVVEGEQVLYPVPAEATDDPGLEDNEDEG